MKVLFAIVVLAVALHSAASAPGGLLGLGGLGGVVVAGPTTISRTSLVQTHPSPVLLAAPHGLAHGPLAVASPLAVSPVIQRTIVAGPALGPLGLTDLSGIGHAW